MDPSSYLDHALFQLTPTRTRCDLVIVGGGVSERLASGLLEPFLCHLKFAKDQISKGGYSITLQPVSTYAPWFTKATLQRFVRFVSTPEVLERFVTIEKEIVQIEGSIQSSDKSNLVAEAEGNVSYADGRVKRSNISSKKGELSGTNQDGYEENSRVRLQRVLDNRKAMLCKEQAMAYARALVAGFYPETMDDLICFADAFGASRLREACLNFLELCKQKNEDKLWMDEIAAMQVSSQPELPYLRTSGIILAGEDDSGGKLNSLVDASISDSTPSHASLDIGQDYSLPTSGQTPSSLDGRAQMPMSWPANHHLQYIHNFQGHAFQQMPPYQGYMYPGMQVPSSYYPGNMQWPPNGDRSHIVPDQESDSHKSSYKKNKKKNKQSQVLETSEEDESSASSESTDESDSDDRSRQSNKKSSTERLHKKKHGTKSSRKVVIRNINYITSNGDGNNSSITEGSLSNEEEFINGDSLKHKSSSRRHKKQHSAKPHGMLNCSTDADSNSLKGNNNWDAFQNLLLRDDDDFTNDTENQSMKFQEEYIMNKNFEDGRSNGFNHDADVTKTRVVSNDYFVVTERESNSKSRDSVEYFKEGKDGPTFMQKKKSSNEELLFSQRNEESGSYFVSNVNQHQDLSMFNGVSISSSATDCLHVEKNNKDILADDSFMIQARRPSQDQFNSQSAADISLVSDIVGTAEFTNRTQESSHKKTEKLTSCEPDDLFMVLDRDSAVEQNAAPWSMEMDYENNISLKETNKKLSDIETDRKNHLSNREGTNKKTTGVKTGKVSGKDAKSKAPNTSLVKSKSDTMSRSRSLPGSKTTITKSKSEKEEENKKRREELMIQRQNRIAERSASKKTGMETKKGNPKLHPSNEETNKKLNKPVLRSSTISRLSTTRVTQQKVSPNQAKSSPTKKPLQKTPATEKKKQLQKEVKSSNHKEDARKTKAKVLSDANVQTKNKIEASVVLPTKSDATQNVEPNNNNIGLKDIGELSNDLPVKHSRYLTSEREIVHEEVSNKLSSLPSENQPRYNTDMIPTSTDALPSKPLIFTDERSKVDQKIDESNVTPPKVSEIQISTPPPSNQVMQESTQTRKKWINDEEDTSKAAKGFRRLLFFGRRS